MSMVVFFMACGGVAEATRIRASDIGKSPSEVSPIDFRRLPVAKLPGVFFNPLNFFPPGPQPV